MARAATASGSGRVLPAPVVVSGRAAAVRLGVSPGTVYRLIRSGALPHTRIGNSLRLSLADLDAYVAGGRSSTWRRVDRRGRPSQ